MCARAGDRNRRRLARHVRQDGARDRQPPSGRPWVSSPGMEWRDPWMDGWREVSGWPSEQMLFLAGAAATHHLTTRQLGREGHGGAVDTPSAAGAWGESGFGAADVILLGTSINSLCLRLLCRAGASGCWALGCSGVLALDAPPFGMGWGFQSSALRLGAGAALVLHVHVVVPVAVVVAAQAGTRDRGTSAPGTCTSAATPRQFAVWLGPSPARRAAVRNGVGRCLALHVVMHPASHDAHATLAAVCCAVLCSACPGWSGGRRAAE